MLTATGPLIKPVYSQDEPGSPIDLGSMSLEFTFAGKAYAEQARVSMQFVPNPRLLFVVPSSGQTGIEVLLEGLDDWDGKLRLVDRSVTVDALCIGRGGASGAFTFMPRTSGVTVTPPSDALVECVFHLPNFPDFSGSEDYRILTGKSPSQGWKRCGRVVLRADGWVVTIAGSDRTRGQCRALRNQSGLAITHVGKIERDDRSPYSSKCLDEFLHRLHHFLSFVLGRWVGLALPVGFDRTGDRVFEQWGMRIAASGAWNGSLSWFDCQHSEQMSAAFPGFMALWRNPTWTQAICTAVYWYLRANEGGAGFGVDTGLILSQVALEHLAWTYCVSDRKMVSEAAFSPRALSASDKLRLLLSGLGVPAAIPDGLRGLQSKPAKKWNDGPDAITCIRNALVHPRENAELPDTSCIEAWQLSMWFLEMTLLRLCGYAGTYGSRLGQRCVGEVDSVPWAQVAQAAGTAGQL